MGVAVAVLNPQDCLKKTFSPKALISPPSKPSRNPNRSNRKPRRSQTGSVSPPPTVDRPASRLFNGSVKILRRGEDLPDLPNSLSESSILGPIPVAESEISASNLVGGFYAGSSACIVSPPPSSLPLPAFFAKKVGSSTNSEATNALLKILRLDLE